MAKKLVAVTNIKHDGVEYEAGSELDPNFCSKEQLKSLYVAGAVAVQDTPDNTEETEEAPAEETPAVEESATPDE